MGATLYDYQADAIKRMTNGCILCGGVGSGKSFTAVAYYYKEQGGNLGFYTGKSDTYYTIPHDIQDLYIITTAKKRDSGEWDGELARFLMARDNSDLPYNNKVVVDSWNNILKYRDVKNAFFIFDEQRVVGKGAWVKSFLKIARFNKWILLSATPGDTWSDYIPVFVANGFYKNRTEFSREHIKYSPYCTQFPKIEGYLNTGRLIRLRNKILVEMDYERHTTLHHETIFCDYDISTYKDLMRNRWNYEKEQPIENASELCYLLRKVSNSHDSRLEEVKKLILQKHKVIIFYNFDYELELLKNLCEFMDISYAQWNGHAHQPIPEETNWVYLVQYNAGAEGWNCIKTDTIIFYSQNYSYKVMVQASGRIDRLTTPFSDLYYYHLRSRSSIDIAIAKALASKKKFNECNFVSFS